MMVLTECGQAKDTSGGFISSGEPALDLFLKLLPDCLIPSTGLFYHVEPTVATFTNTKLDVYTWNTEGKGKEAERHNYVC